MPATCGRPAWSVQAFAKVNIASSGGVPRVVFVTGSDTGVGKTVFACLLARHMFQRGLSVTAYKPLCSGGRADALALQAALGGIPDIERLNPWHFRAPVAPLLAARREGKVIRLADVVAGAKRLLLEHDFLIVEGAGGLLSPMGEGFNALDLIRRLHALPVVVCPNRLGVVNQALLVLAALPGVYGQRAQTVLVGQREPDASAASNAALLAEQIGAGWVHSLPWLRREPGGSEVESKVTAMLDGLLAALGLPSKA